MLGAIGSSSFSGTTGTGASTAVLEAQLAQYQRQLSDCIHCSSAKTPEGKAAIQILSDKISAVKKHIEGGDIAKSTSQPTTKPSLTVSTDKDRAALSGRDKTGIDSVSATSSAGTAVGSLVNVFA